MNIAPEHWYLNPHLTPPQVSRGRVLLAQLELVSCGTITKLDNNGNEGTAPSPPGCAGADHLHYRRCLATATTSQADTLIKEMAAEWQALTGRTGKPPVHHNAQLDDPKQLRRLILDQEGVLSEHVAAELKIPERVVFNIRQTEGVRGDNGNPLDDAIPVGADRARKVRELTDQGRSERQIKMMLGLSSTTQVRRALGKAA